MDKRVREGIRSFCVMFLLLFIPGVLICIPTEGFPTPTGIIDLPGPDGAFLSCVLETTLGSIFAGLLAASYVLYFRE